MAKKNLPYPAEKIGELLIEVDNEVAKKSDLNDFVKKESGRGLSTNDYSTAEKNKLAGIQEGAQKNTVTSVRGALQLNPQVGNVVISAADIGLGNANTRLTSLENNKLDKSEKGATNGVASLDENGRVPSSQLPSYVDDVVDEYTYAQFPTTGETGKIYIAKDTNKTYRWSGSGYAEISASLALGETEQTAYSGAKGKKNAEDIAKLAKDLDVTHQLASNAESAISEVVESVIPALDSNKLGKTEKAADSAKADSAPELSVKTTTVTSVTNAALTYHLVLAANVGSLPYGDNANAVITIPTLAGNLKYLHQLGFTGKGLFWRKMYNKDVDATTAWSQIAFTDSTVANADSTTKLATARTIWGQSFDGTGDVDGQPTINGSIVLRATAADAWRVIRFMQTAGNANAGEILFQAGVNINGVKIAAEYGDWASRQNLVIYTSNNTASPYVPVWVAALMVKYNGNVGIGTTPPTEKLDVAGNIKASGTMTATTLQGNLNGTIQKDLRDDNLYLLGIAKEAGSSAKPYATTLVSINNGVLTIKGLRVEGDVEITGDTVIQGSLTSGASYQATPLATTSEEGDTPTVEQQLRAQISSLEERIATLERIIAQNNG